MLTKTDQKIGALRVKVEAAHQEFDMAVVFHEVWKPAVYDEDLGKRMGVSYATNTFHIVRVALRREMLLALLRLWDHDSRAIRMTYIAETLRDTKVVDALVADRASSVPLNGMIKRELSQKADKAIMLVEKYSGSSWKVVGKNGALMLT